MRVAVLTATFLAVAVVPSSALAQLSLVASYPLDGDALDASGNGLDGAVTGATPTTDRFGTPSSAYAFDGVDDVITIGADPLFDLGSAYTLSAWIRPVSTSVFFTTIVGRWSGSSVWESFWLGVYNLTPPFLFGENTTVEAGNQTIQSAPTPPLIQLDQWQHVAFTYDDSTDQLILYIDGTPLTPQFGGSGTGTLQVAANESVSIGALFRGTTTIEHPFAGSIDQVCIYQGAMSASQVADLAAANSCLLPAARVPALGGWWLLSLVLLLPLAAGLRSLRQSGARLG